MVFLGWESAAGAPPLDCPKRQRLSPWPEHSTGCC